MGQYYHPIMTNKPLNKENVGFSGENLINWFYSHDHGSGLKLMEHSYMNNCFVGLVTSKLLKGPMHIVWAGDYADKEEYDIMGGEGNLYTLCDDHNKLSGNPLEYSDQKKFNKRFKYLINHSINEYVNYLDCPKDDEGWQVHPLPLLTCEGNGRGGGDYRLDNDYTGRWARDLISVSNRKPGKGFELIKPNFLMD